MYNWYVHILFTVEQLTLKVKHLLFLKKETSISCYTQEGMQNLSFSYDLFVLVYHIWGWCFLICFFTTSTRRSLRLVDGEDAAGACRQTAINCSELESHGRHQWVIPLPSCPQFSPTPLSVCGFTGKEIGCGLNSSDNLTCAQACELVTRQRRLMIQSFYKSSPCSRKNWMVHCFCAVL
jgi:hypothetical protein